MFCIMLTFNVSAQKKVEVDGIAYYVYSGKTDAAVTIKSRSEPYTGDIVVPETFVYDGTKYTVTKIGNVAFNACNVTSVTIPNTVTEIGESAFSYSRKLKSVSIPNSVQTIGDGAFAGCDGVENIVFEPDNKRFKFSDNFILTYDGTTIISAFLKTTDDELVLPNTITAIGNGAFSGFINIDIKSVKLPSSLVSIGDEAFENSCIRKIAIPKGVAHIGEGAFATSKRLKLMLTIEDDNENYIMENDMLLDAAKKNLLFASPRQHVYNIPESVTRICNYSFYGCERITEITIPDNVQGIGYFAFNACI